MQLILMLLALPATLAVSTTIVTVTAPPAPASTSFVNDTVFRNDMLAAHNFYRAEQGVKNLTWNDTSAKFAANYSKACVFVHSSGPTGENLAAGYDNATASVDAWGIERLQYNFDKPTGFTEETGHFTQLVWSNTTSVGCGRTSCGGRNNTPGYYVVCEYYPAGNVIGDNNQYFINNVLKQAKGKPIDTVETGMSATSATSSAYALRDEIRRVLVLGVAVVVGVGLLG